MTVDEIMEYVMTTPENTNASVLKDMLDQLASSSGGGSSSECEYSIANLRITNTSNPDEEDYGTIIYTNNLTYNNIYLGEFGIDSDATSATYEVEAGDAVTDIAVVFKEGECTIEIKAGEIPTITGAIELTNSAEVGDYILC